VVVAAVHAGWAVVEAELAGSLKMAPRGAVSRSARRSGTARIAKSLARAHKARAMIVRKEP
jgi:hypothetical protein